MKRNQILAIALIGAFSVTIVAGLFAGNVFRVMSVAPGTTPIIAPMIVSVSANVYDASVITTENQIPTLPLKGIATPSIPFEDSTNKLPGIEVFTSQTFFSSPSGAHLTSPYLDVQHVVSNGVEYIATGTYYAIDVGARTHVDFSTIPSTQRFQGARVSPLVGKEWHADSAYLGSTTWFKDIISNDPVYNNVNYRYYGVMPEKNSINSASDYNSAYGSLCFTCDAGAGAGAGAIITGRWFQYYWGATTGTGRPAYITQSLAPFFNDGKTVVSELTWDWFQDTPGNSGGGDNQGQQSSYMTNNYKIGMAYVVPKVTLRVNSAPVWAPYTKEVTHDGSSVMMTVDNKNVTSGFRSTYIANLTQYDQHDFITSNAHVQTASDLDVPLSSTNPGTTSTTSTSAVDSQDHASEHSGAAGYLHYNGNEVLPNGSPFFSSLTGAASGSQNIKGLPKGDYHFDVSNLQTNTERQAISTMPTQVDLSSTYTMQPSSTLSWADEVVHAEWYIWDGYFCETFNDKPGGVPNAITWHVYYPMAISANNAYVIQRWVVEVWSLSAYSISYKTPSGQPINGALFTDDELTSLVNDPNKDENKQHVDFDPPTDWNTILIVIGIGIFVLIIIGIVGSAMIRKQSMDIRIPYGYTSVESSQNIVRSTSFTTRMKNWLSGSVARSKSAPDFYKYRRKM